MHSGEMGSSKIFKSRGMPCQINWCDNERSYYEDI